MYMPADESVFLVYPAVFAICKPMNMAYPELKVGSM